VAFDRAEAELGLPDVLVNNAAANFPVACHPCQPWVASAARGEQALSGP
jgi:NAD(P)-dependent dehydrogenase (short-subunit alcohol dehydrogenase family)